MNINVLIKSLGNKLEMLESKKKVSVEKGRIDLYDIFDIEYNETLSTLGTIITVSKKSKVCSVSDIKDKLKPLLFECLPNLSFYIKKSSINDAVNKGLEQAIDMFIYEEDLFDKTLRIVKEDKP